ncbi:unnamed protein product [Acanthoscelides obtectus]|uniref:HDAg domain-containing protein n=1 Tax=Acanthoscelides obtectus TaxID=200917 RepID=A0A9P0K7A0_ACAOB|nr:unnamed protein product [Acanthoscelides obtectus]CAK1626829.1 Negative elongation factor A [Acanthoscelides obtectus]
MANVRDSDTSLWLHNKLGISNDSWTGGSICSQLNAEVLRNIKDCFPDLQTQVKLKLLLSFFHIPRRNLEEWKSELEQILDVAVQDSELWVGMLADALKTYPSTGSLNTEISDVDEVRPIFNDLITDLRKLVRKQNDHSILPVECHYLNKAALVSVVGNRPEPLRHFTIKKKPKSALLRADLLQKSSDAASNLNKKSSAPVIPVRSRGMPRKMTDTTPLKGIPSRVPTSGFRSGVLNSNMSNRPPIRGPAGRKEGGVKLLDIADQPLGYAAAKKRKKMQEMEDAAKKASETAAMQSPPPATGGNAAAAAGGGGTTPDYAAGLTATPTYAPPATPQPVTAATATPTSTVPASIPPTPQQQTTATVVSLQPQQQPATTTTPAPPLVAALPPAQQHQATPTAAVAPPSSVTLVATPIQAAQPQVVQVAQQQPTNQSQVQFAAQAAMRPVPPLLATTGAVQVQQTQIQPGTQVQQIIGTPVVITQRPVQQQQTVTHIRIQPQPATNVLQRRGLALTREQMLEAQDMFRTANKVTRPEKALILGFMAGSRDNPCPHLGNIVTIKLSEDQENVLQPDDTYLTMLVETHFQMNYNNGEWKRIKKYRHVENMVEQITQSTPTAALV